MPDDDKQPSYERLDETNPEHNRRSFFDWLRGKEETDEEKLRKKLDEDLKQAARKRAEQFEEEQRDEEQREVAETRKLKKRWRAKLVEKSKKLLDDASEKGDEPANGYEVAKLMVAERIVKLHDMLLDEGLDMRRSEIKSLKIHIDFMGLLSEKLDNPELEVPEEIEQLYQAIAASVEETTGEKQPHATLPEQPEIVPVSEADTAYTTFAASIVKAIRRVVQSENAPVSDAGSGPEVRSAPPKGIPRPVSEPVVSAPRPTEQLLSIVQGTALSGEAIRKEITRTDDARRLAEVVEKATIIDRYVAHQAVRPAQVNERTEQPEQSEKGFDLAPNKKIKYLTEPELLSLASTVEIGSGRLLSDVYKKGELDREGLIKVLESYHKGQDYRSEFTFRREKWRHHRQESPEYLAQPAGTQAPSPVSQQIAQFVPEKVEDRTKEVGRQITSLAVAPIRKGGGRDIGYSPSKKSESPARIVPELPRIIGDLKGRLQRQNQVALMLVTVLLVAVIFIVVVQLNTR